MKNLKAYFAGFLTAILAVTLVTTVLATQSSQQVTIYYNDIKIRIDGEAITPKDVNGNSVEPFILNDSTYLPVRAVSEAVGYDVGWDGNTSTVILTEKKPPKSPDFLVNAEYYSADGFGILIIFYDDGTFIIDQGYGAVHGSYSVDGNTISVQFEGDPSDSDNYAWFEITGYGTIEDMHGTIYDIKALPRG